MYFYYMTIKDKPKGSRRNAPTIGEKRTTLNWTINNDYGTRRMIDKNLLTPVEIDKIE